MTYLTLYWNHICVLHRQEKAFLEACTAKLAEEGIQLSIRYFGLGYPMHLSDYLAQPDAVLPDLIVSADMEVFEDPRIYSKFSNELYSAGEWAPLRENAALSSIEKTKKLLPFVSIPLVYFTSDTAFSGISQVLEANPRTGADKSDTTFSFGGIHNSAGKGIVKSVWSRYGKHAAKALLEQSLVTDMPIGAFQAVRTGRVQTALVPSLYALRADERSSFLKVPSEGPVLISSYFCARTSAPVAAAKRAAELLLSPEFCEFYAKNGDLIVHPAFTNVHSRQESDRFFVPDRQFLDQLNPDEFYALYTSMLPSAYDPFRRKASLLHP